MEQLLESEDESGRLNLLYDKMRPGSRGVNPLQLRAVELIIAANVGAQWAHKDLFTASEIQVRTERPRARRGGRADREACVGTGAVVHHRSRSVDAATAVPRRRRKIDGRRVLRRRRHRDAGLDAHGREVGKAWSHRCCAGDDGDVSVAGGGSA